MMPWEEEWHAAESNNFMTGGWKIRNEACAPRCALIGAYGDDEALAKFVSSAPKMARALLALGAMSDGFHRAKAGWHTHQCSTARMEYGAPRCLDSCKEAQEALATAGVLP